MIPFTGACAVKGVKFDFEMLQTSIILFQGIALMSSIYCFDLLEPRASARFY